jgi:predicted RNA binding protein YcfA (HicA-like mRNA interferase family)
MSRLPRLTGRDIVAALSRGGFRLLHVRGSHHYLEPPGGKGLVTVPVHAGKIVKPGTLKNILEQADLSLEEFIDLL